VDSPRSHRLLLAKVGCLVWIIAATSTPARASLSGPPTSIEEDRAALHATLREEVQSAYTIEHVALPNGVEVREFLSRGRVFGVAWSGPFKPDLQQILGSHFSTFVFEATKAARYWSGRKITFGTPSDSTTATAFADVQHTSDSAFTSADVFT